MLTFAIVFTVRQSVHPVSADQTSRQSSSGFWECEIALGGALGVCEDARVYARRELYQAYS